MKHYPRNIVKFDLLFFVVVVKDFCVWVHKEYWSALLSSFEKYLFVWLR